MNVLLSIKPKYVNEILSGKKLFEFRKAIFKKKDIGKVFIYSSSPVKKIVASFEIARIIADSPKKIWDKCHEYGGIPENDFFDYFKNSDTAYAIEISNLDIFSEPIDPYKLKKDFRPPQSYCYLSLDYFDEKSYRNTSIKEYEAVFLAEDCKEYGAKISAVDEETTGLNQLSEPKERKIGWVHVTLNDIAKWGSGGTPKSTNPNYYGGNIPWLIIGDLNDGYVWESEKKITEEGLKNSSSKIVAPESVLVAMYGSIGKLGINKIPMATNQAIAFTEKLYVPTYNKYLFYYLLFSRPKLYKMGKGGTQRNISQTVLKTVDFPLPPLPEQRAIVSKIELLFSELDNGIANLKLAQEQLKVYKQAVLKKAFEGELTKKWREQHGDLPSVDELLVEIKKEREEAAKSYDKKLKDVKPLNDAELKLLSELPDNWMWLKIGTFTLGVEYGTSTKSNKVGQVPVLRMGNIQNGRFDWNDLVYTSDQTEIEKYRLEKDDVLFNRTNSPELVGKTAIYRGEKTAIFAGYLIRINQLPTLVTADYLNHFMNCHIAKVYGNTVKTDGVNQSNINGEKLRNYPFPLCSLPEQQAIVNEIETRLSVCDKVEQDIVDNLEKAEALRQSILKKAFEGKLLSERELEEVRKAEDWEPAEKLLKRVKAEKKGRK